MRKERRRGQPWQVACACVLLLAGWGGDAREANAGCPATQEPYVLYSEPVRPFSDVFNLWVRPQLLEDWSADDFRGFMEAVFDSNRATDEDLFPRIWNYFCHSDRDTTWDRIRVGVAGRDLTRLDIYLKGVEAGPAHAGGGRMYLGAYSLGPFDPGSGEFASCEVLPPREVALNSSLAHEMVHLAHECNTGGQTGAFWSNEMMATASESVVGWRSSRYGVLFDQPFPARGRSAPNYSHYRLLMAYLFARFAGDPDRDEDDLLYRWLRAADGNRPNIQFYGLARTLEEPAPAGWDALPGDTGDERVAALFQRLAVARFVDRPAEGDGRYGFGGLIEAGDLNFFTWPDTNVVRVRCLPPRWQVGEDAVGREVSAVSFVDPVDTGKGIQCRERDLGIRGWGSDYLVLAADSTWFAERGDRSLRFRLDPIQPLKEGWRLQVGYLVYASSDSLLSGRPVGEIVEMAAGIGPEDDAARFEVSAFGTTGRSLVVVVTLVQDPIPPVIEDCVDRSLQCLGTGGCSEPAVRYRVGWELATGG